MCTVEIVVIIDPLIFIFVATEYLVRLCQLLRNRRTIYWLYCCWLRYRRCKLEHPRIIKAKFTEVVRTFVQRTLRYLLTTVQINYRAAQKPKMLNFIKV